MPVVLALVVAILLWPLACLAERAPACEQQLTDAVPTVPAAPLKLTDAGPSGFFPIAPKTVIAAPAVLSLSVTQVVNPEKAAVEIFLYLVRFDSEHTPKEKIFVGQFGLFPPDHPARFTLRSSGAFQKLLAAGPAPNSNQVRLLLELKPISGKKPLSKIELTIAPPEWAPEDRH